MEINNFEMILSIDYYKNMDQEKTLHVENSLNHE